MKNIILLFLGLDKSVDTTNMKTTQSIVAEKIYNEKTLAELFILKIKQLKNIDEIILLGYDYSEIPFSSKESLTQSALVKEICKSNEIKYIEYDFKYSLSNYWTNFEKAQEYTVSKFNEFANINDNLIQIYDNNYFFDIELLEQMIANHIEKNAELTHSTDLRLNYFTILKWNNSLKFENINEFLPTSAFVNKYQFFRLPKNKIDDIDLFKISFNKTNKNVIDFKDFFEFYLKNKNIFFDFPEHIVIELTDECNHNCFYCPNSIKKNNIDIKSKYFSFELFKKIVDEIKGNNIDKKIVFEFSGYGEPLMNKDIFSMIEYVKKKLINNVEIDIYTNGEFIDLEVYKKMQTLKVDNIFISIDAVSKEKYQQIHKADCFDKILRNLNDIVNYKKNNKITIPKIIPNFVLCNINENESIEFIKKFGIRLELIKKLQQYNNTIVENELYSGNYLPFDYAVIRGVNDFSGQMENKKVADYTPPQRNYCRQFSTGLFIKADGNITICRNDFKGNYSLGSIKNQSIKDILLSKKYEGYCEKHEKLDFSGIDLCKNCRNWYEVY